MIYRLYRLYQVYNIFQNNVEFFFKFLRKDAYNISKKILSVQQKERHILDSNSDPPPPPCVSKNDVFPCHPVESRVIVPNKNSACIKFLALKFLFSFKEPTYAMLQPLNNSYSNFQEVHSRRKCR